MIKDYDLIIIGAGPAGLTAAVYGARYKMNCLVIGKALGGVMIKGYEIANFPSYEKILGVEFMQKLEKQAKQLGVEIKYEEVMDLKKKADEFLVRTNKSEYSAKKIILATGTEKGKLNLPNEKELTGHGISYCSTCDAFFFKNKTVGVVGGGNSALKSALLLSKFADKVYLIYKGEKFSKPESNLIRKIKKNRKISVLFNSTVTKVIGKEQLEEIEIMIENKKSQKIKIDGLFVEIGSVADDRLAKKLNIKFDGDFVEVNKKQETNIKGVFAAGDITNNPLKQIITACSEGAVAADSAHKN